MNDLMRWFGEQLDEDEHAVRRVLGESALLAIAEDGKPAPRWVPHPKNDVGIWDTDRIPRVKYAYPREREHILRHDPARVLREIEGKRKILREFERCGPKAQGHSGLRYAVQCLAESYDQQPGYLEKWRP